MAPLAGLILQGLASSSSFTLIPQMVSLFSVSQHIVGLHVFPGVNPLAIGSCFPLSTGEMERAMHTCFADAAEKRVRWACADTSAGTSTKVVADPVS